MRGFTLAELMGVIVILGILAVVITTTIDKNITNSRNETCKSQEENLIQAAQMYVTDNPDVLPSIGSSADITIGMLRGDSSGYEGNNYIDDDMENPMTDEVYLSTTAVRISLSADETGQTSDPKNYHYEVVYDTANGDKECPE